MPRERQKRGRRGEAKKDNKRKRGHDGEETDTVKRQKSQDHENYITPSQPDGAFENADDYIPLDDGTAPADDTPFYGLLDSDEQEYFSRANQTLDLNQFESDEDRTLFIAGVLEEANGKELKIACSQSCSRLMEKLISMSDTGQLKHLFSKFTGNFLHLVQHRFASHCCERLFVRAAPIVTYENKPRTKETANKEEEESDETRESNLPMVDLVLNAISELEGNWGYLLTESFASHTIRVLLLVLAGEPVDNSSNIAVVASRKKENLASLKAIDQAEKLTERRNVPPVFKDALEKMVNDLIKGLDTTYLRALATHPVGSPVLQVLLAVELTHLGKDRVKDLNSVLRRLIPDDPLENTDSATFINGLFYDPVGSRLLETLLRHVPGKFFKMIYKSLVRDRTNSLSRNEIASYVVVRILERLSKEDLQAATDAILREIPAMIERSRLNVIKALIERGSVRGTDLTALADMLKSSFGEDPVARFQKILKLETAAEASDEGPKKTASISPQQIHGSLVAQAMLQVPGPLSEMIHESLLAIPTSTLLDAAKSPAASHVIQESLDASKPTSRFRRQFIPKFLGHIGDLSIDSSGSHVVDALWQATSDLLFLKQRLAEELASNEKTLRDSFLGRAVWRNWSMDLYKRKRGEWVSKAKGLDSSGINTTDVSGESAKPKSRLDLARERYAAQAEAKSNKTTAKSQGSNVAERKRKIPESGLMAA